MQEAWGKTSLKSIAKHLGRSENAVIVRIQRLGLGPGLQAGERISWNQFAIALSGRNGGGYLKKRLLAAGFPVHTQIIRGQNKARFTTVDIEEFWKFAEQNKDLFDFSKMEPYVFGPEPEWATLKRRLDTERLRKGRSHNDPWTPAQDKELQRLLSLYKYTYTEIAEKLKRSEGAIKRRIVTLGIKDWPIRKPSRPWTEAEEKELIRMRGEGYGWDNIAAALDRTALCVRGKYERLLNPRVWRNAREGRVKQDRQETCSRYIKLRGCEIGRESCRYCRHYQQLQEGEKQRSDYIGIREIKPEQIREHQEISALAFEADWQQVSEGVSTH